VTLTCLEGHIEDGVSDQLLSILPPNLTKLKTVYKPSLISIEALQQAPRGLIDIRSEIGMGQSDILQYFHPDSTTIRFGRNLGNRVAVPLNLHPFPSKLTRLKLGCFTDELCLLLPSELESLLIAGGQITAKGASKISTLRPLRKLDVYIDAIVDEVVPHLSRIKKLGFWSDRGMSFETVKLSFDFVRLLLSPAPTEGIFNELEAYPSCSSTKPKPLNSLGTNSSIEKLTFHFASWGEAQLYLRKETFRTFEAYCT
jgi:hypothetical protein